MAGATKLLTAGGGGVILTPASSIASDVTVSLPTTNGITLVGGTNGIAPEASGGTGTTTGYYGFKNRIINGAMMIDQRNAGGAVAVINGTYAVDRFITSASQTGKLTTAQKNGIDTSATNYEAGASPTGFINSLKYSSASAYSSLANDYFLVTQRIEGTNVSDLGFGTANSQTVTLSFWVKSSLTGTFAGSLNNAGGGSPRSYVFTYSVTNANTWEQKAVTVTGDTSGTWLTSSGIGLQVRFDLGCGTDFNTTVGSWQSGAYYRVSGAQSIVGTSGATFYITGVQLEKGSTATSFDCRPYGTELALCQRYYYGETGGQYFTGYGTSPGGQALTWQRLPVTMRASPTVTVGTLTNGTSLVGPSSNTALWFCTCTPSSGSAPAVSGFTASAEL